MVKNCQSDDELVSPKQGKTADAPSGERDYWTEAVDQWRRDIAFGVRDNASDPILELSAAHPSGLAQLYAGRETRLSSLVREPGALAFVKRRAHEVMDRLTDQSSRFGFAQAHLAIGTAQWHDPLPPTMSTNDDMTGGTAASKGDDAKSNEETSTADRASQTLITTPAPIMPLGQHHCEPVLLRLVTMRTDSAGEVTLQLEPEMELDDRLWKALDSAGAKTNASQILQAANTPHGFSPGGALAIVDDLGRDLLVGFDIVESLTVGQFVQPSQLLLADLQANMGRLRANPLVCALVKSPSQPEADSREDDPGEEAKICAVVQSDNDDEAAASSRITVVSGADSTANADRPPARDVSGIGLDGGVLPPAVPTDRQPNLEHGVGDLDVDQHTILDAVAAGTSLVLNAPPGCADIATMGALLVDSASSGRVCVFVPGQRGFGTQMASWLQSQGMGELVLDLSDPALPTSQVQDKLRAAFDTSGANAPDPYGIDQMRQELVQVRNSLDHYVQTLHGKQRPWGVSAHDALQVLTDLTATRPGPRTQVRFSRRTLTIIASDGAAGARAALKGAGDLGIFSQKRSNTPWYGAIISAPDKVAGIVERVQILARETLPLLFSFISEAAKATGLEQAKTIAAWHEQLDLFSDIAQTLRTFKPDIFRESAADMVIATASKKWREERNLNMPASVRRKLVRQAKEFLVTPGASDDIHAALVTVQEQRQTWQNLSKDGGFARLPKSLPQMKLITDQVCAELADLDPVFATAYGDLQRIHIEDLVTLMQRLADDPLGAQRIPQQLQVLSKLREYGLMELVDDLREREVPLRLVVPELDLAWWASALGIMMKQDQQLATLGGQELNALVERLCALDRQQISCLSALALRSAKRQIKMALELAGDQAELLFHSLDRTVALPWRDIIRDFPLAHRLCPILIVPPVMVPQLFPGQAQIDLLLTAGIASTKVAELLPALLRAKQVVAVGDIHGNSQAAVGELARVLPLLTIPPERGRQNEYISEFLAAHGYGRAVLSVPVPRFKSSISLEIVDGRGMPAPDKTAIESTQAEVGRVVDLVIEQALTSPDASLAVVALNARHAGRIREALIGIVAQSPAVDQFFSSAKVEPFVIVEPSQAQSLVRDQIILSVGYGKTPHGRALHDFGNISGPQGSALLTDALLTVRQKLVVVSAISPAEIDRSRLNCPGAIMLADLLQMAADASGEHSINEVARSMSEEEAAPDRLLVDLAERLYAMGLTVVPNFGLGQGLRIPLAIGHPELPDELLVAVMTDSPEYVAEKSLRRRDRHWRERLESYGWIVHMVFSTAVFVDPSGEAEKIVNLVMDILVERDAAARSRESDDIQIGSGTDQPKLFSSSDDNIRADEDGLADSQSSREAVPAGDMLLTQSAQYSSTVPDACTDQSGLMPESQQGQAGPIERSEPRPPIAPGLPLAAYSDDQLDELVEWIMSDGVVRSEDEVAALLRQELNLTRQGNQVEAVLRNVIRRQN